MQLLRQNGAGANQSRESYTRDLHTHYLQLQFDWLVSLPFHRKCPVSVVNACLETVHVKTVSNERCASFAWVSHIKGCKCRIVVMLCWYARVNVTTRLTLLDLDPSPSIIIILYHMRQLQVTQNLP